LITFSQWELLDEKSSEPWSQRRLPTVTATYPAVIDSDIEEDEAREFLRPRKCGKSATRPSGMSNQENFLENNCTAEQAVSKQIRALRKKLQQIEILEAKQLAGHQLDNQQQAKLESRAALESELAELGVPSEAYSQTSSVCPAEGRTNKKPEVSKKQKRKNKQAPQSSTPSVKSESGQQIPIKNLQEVLPTNVSAEKVRLCRVALLSYDFYMVSCFPSLCGDMLISIKTELLPSSYNIGHPSIFMAD
jgi:hypothetical protein